MIFGGYEIKSPLNVGSEDKFRKTFRRIAVGLLVGFSSFGFRLSCKYLIADSHSLLANVSSDTLIY